jgi:hypothetical protein
MSEREEFEVTEAGVNGELLPPDPDERTQAVPASTESRLPSPFRSAPERRSERVDERAPSRPAPPRRSRLASVAIVAAAAVLAGGAFVAFNAHRVAAGLIAEQADETKALVKSVDALNARLSVIESVKSHDELVELRRSIGQVQSNVEASRGLSGALAELSQRVDKLDRQENAKADKLNASVERETSAQTAGLAARIDKLEKVVASAAPAPAPANPPAPPQKPSLPAPKLGPNVSMETTGSIERPRPILRGYIVLGARDDVALVEGRYGDRAVRRGDFLPGAGRVEGITRADGSWIVLTERGQILPAYEPY